MSFLRKRLPMISKGKLRNALFDPEDMDEYLEKYWDAGPRHNRLFLETKRGREKHGRGFFMVSPREASSLLKELRGNK
jgi:hypothetical protein